MSRMRLMFMREAFKGVWMDRRRIFTASLVPHDVSFAKSTIMKDGREFREWDPERSKPAAAILKGIGNFPIGEGCKVLYLGIASGATASFFSDIVGENGVIYGVEISERSVRDLNAVAEKRGNIVPILADARKPEEYAWVEPVDVVYEDVASDDQSPIIIRNSERFLKKDGHAVIAIKARSIDVTKEPRKVYAEELEKLAKHFKILEKVELDPFEKDHLFVIMRPKKQEECDHARKHNPSRH